MSKRRKRCNNCGELDYDLQDVYNFKDDKSYKYYIENKYDKDLDIMDYLDKSTKSKYCEYCFDNVTQ